MDRVRVILGDTDNTPYGGGTWASRGAGIGGEAALQATKVLRKNILDVAAAVLQSTPGELDIVNNGVVNAVDGTPRIDLSELARIVYFRPIRCRRAFSPSLWLPGTLSRANTPSPSPMAFRPRGWRSIPIPAL
jgi:carbon-monoxide dehydrogenase large subunit